MTANAYTWIDDLTRKYTPSSTQFNAARSHRAAIESRLDAFLGIFGMFEIGSLRHGTGVWLYSDADFLVSLKGSRPTSPWTTLTKVKETLQERFKSTTIVIRQPAVVCYFSDGVVEVVPAFHDNGYWIADPTGGWMKTHPTEHNKYVNEINAKHNGAAKALVRQLKIWKYLRDVPVSSCYLEMRAAKYLSGESTYAVLFDLHGALKHLEGVALASMNDPTGLSSRFGACSSDAKRTEALSRLSMAVTRARKAKEYAGDGEHVNAIAQLKLLFNR